MHGSKLNDEAKHRCEDDYYCCTDGAYRSAISFYVCHAISCLLSVSLPSCIRFSAAHQIFEQSFHLSPGRPLRASLEILHVFCFLYRPPQEQNQSIQTIYQNISFKTVNLEKGIINVR